MSTLIECFQFHLAAALEGRDFVVMGENVNNGSRISGLGKGLDKLSRVKVLNVGNCELTHVGAGMGMMLAGGRAVLLVKQLDFMLLGLDQMVNTLNWIRANRANRNAPLGSFTIITYLCDQGFQGPQSSLVDLNGFCSLGGFPGFLLQEESQLEAVLRHELSAPGFRIIGIPQRLATQELRRIALSQIDEMNGVRRYGEGTEIAIVSCHSSFPEALRLSELLAQAGLHSSILLSSLVPGADPARSLRSSPAPGHIVILDDSKGILKWGDTVARKCREHLRSAQLHFFERSFPIPFGVQADLVAWDFTKLLKELSTP